MGLRDEVVESRLAHVQREFFGEARADGCDRRLFPNDQTFEFADDARAQRLVETIAFGVHLRGCEAVLLHSRVKNGMSAAVALPEIVEIPLRASRKPVDQRFGEPQVEFRGSDCHKSKRRRVFADPSGVDEDSVGRRYRTRTDDPHRVKVMLYQLS